MAKKIKKRIKTKHFSELIPSRVKMSEVLLDYAEPLLNEAYSIESREKAILMAVICWNISLLPEEEQKEMIKDVLAKISKSGDNDTTKSIIMMLIERKKMFFPEHSNFIVNYKVSVTDGGKLSLTVMSAEK